MEALFQGGFPFPDGFIEMAPYPDQAMEVLFKLALIHGFHPGVKLVLRRATALNKLPSKIAQKLPLVTRF